MALAGGPWFLFDHYLAVQPWKINFVPSDEMLSTMPIWVQLHKLPLELYDMRALAKIGKTLGRPMKVDIHTIEVSRGRYACMCVEMDTSQPLPPVIQVGSRLHPVTYELCVTFCHKCGLIGHLMLECPNKITGNVISDNLATGTSDDPKIWKTITRKPFVRRKNMNQGRQNTNTGTTRANAVKPRNIQQPKDQGNLGKDKKDNQVSVAATPLAQTPTVTDKIAAENTHESDVEERRWMTLMLVPILLRLWKQKKAKLIQLSI